MICCSATVSQCVLSSLKCRCYACAGVVDQPDMRAPVCLDIFSLEPIPSAFSFPVHPRTFSASISRRCSHSTVDLLMTPVFYTSSAPRVKAINPGVPFVDSNGTCPISGKTLHQHLIHFVCRKKTPLSPFSVKKAAFIHFAVSAPLLNQQDMTLAYHVQSLLHTARLPSLSTTTINSSIPRAMHLHRCILQEPMHTSYLCHVCCRLAALPSGSSCCSWAVQGPSASSSYL